MIALFPHHLPLAVAGQRFFDSSSITVGSVKFLCRNINENDVRLLDLRLVMIQFCTIFTVFSHKKNIYLLALECNEWLVDIFGCIVG